MYKMVRSLLVLVLAASLVAGCSKDGDKGGTGGGKGGAVAKAKTPKEAVTNMSKAIEKMDKDQFLASTYLGEGGKEFAEAMFDTMAAMTAFGKEMEKAYGKDAIAGMVEQTPALTDEELAKLVIKEEGEKATATDPKGKPVRLVKKDGAWLVDMSEDVPKGEERAKALKEAKAMAKAYNDVRPKIGKGMTKEQIAEELGKAMKAAMPEK